MSRAFPDYRPVDWKGDYVDRPLVDDLATVLASTVLGWEAITNINLSEHHEVRRVLARYRQEQNGL